MHEACYLLFNSIHNTPNIILGLRKVRTSSKEAITKVLETFGKVALEDLAVKRNEELKQTSDGLKQKRVAITHFEDAIRKKMFSFKKDGEQYIEALQMISSADDSDCEFFLRM